MRTLRRLYDAATGDDERRRLSFLLNLGIEGFLGNETKELSDDIANTESRAKITVDGEQIGLRYSSVVQANEPDRDRRRRINDARLELTSTVLNPLYDRRWRRLHELVGELGYPTYSELFSEVRAVDFGMLRGATQMFLQATEGLYQRTLDKVAPRQARALARTELEVLRPAVPRARPRIRPHLRRATSSCPPSSARSRASASRSPRSPTCTSTPRARELKSPRAFCAPVRIPDEIYLVVMPKGGQDDFQALLHEGGHTEHFAHTSPDLPFEYRFLGDNAVTEGFAFVFDHLILNPRWLETYLDYADSREYLTFANLVELYFLRRYAGKLAYETEFHVQTGPLGDMAARYGALLSRSRADRRAQARATWSTSTTASTPPTTCGPGCSRGRCACCCKTTTAWSGSSTPPPASGSRGCGRRARCTRPTSSCSRTAAAGSTRGRSSCTSSGRSVARSPARLRSVGDRAPAQPGA